MPLDAICMTALAQELRSTLLGGKIDKIYQPTRDEVVLHMRTGQGNVRLLLSANPQHPRAHITAITNSASRGGCWSCASPLWSGCWTSGSRP